MAPQTVPRILGSAPEPKVKTPVGDTPVIPVLLLIAGGYLAWFGVHYWRDKTTKWPTDPIKDILQGKPQPNSKPQETAIQLLADVESSTGGGGAAGGSSSATGSEIADDALKYVGAGYVWGGNADKPGNWDCSSFVSYVLGHDLDIPLPGGNWGNPGFPPHAHGPTTVTYLVYGHPIGRAEVQAGDLIVWQTHMGIAISNNEMVSARDPQEGTGKDTIDGDIPGETPHFRRVTAKQTPASVIGGSTVRTQ